MTVRKKRQRTNWLFNAVDSIGGGIRVGRVYNPKWDFKPDVVRLQIKARNDFIDLHMTIDEAVIISAGLCKVVGRELWTATDIDVRKPYESESAR